MEPYKSDLAKEEDFLTIVHHYGSLFWRRKWLVLGIVPLIGAVCIFGLLKFGFLRPNLPATVLIGMDRPLQTNAGITTEDGGPKNIELIQSRNLLQEVVKNLSLCLNVEGSPRRTIFDTIQLGPNSYTGQYRFVLDQSKPGSFVILGYRPGFPREAVYRGTLADTRGIRFHGGYLRLQDSFIRNPRNFTFHITSSRKAVDGILDRMVIERPTNRRGTFFSITLTGSDYALTSQTVNAIADMFVTQSMSFQKRRIHQKLGMLGKQLELTKNQLAISENNLQQFLMANPTIASDKQTERTLGDLQQQETMSMDMKSTLNNGVKLQNQLRDAVNEEQIDIVKESLMFLASKNTIRASILQNQFLNLLAEREELVGNYSKDHPLLQQNKLEINAIVTQTAIALDSFLQNILQNLSQKGANINQIASRLKTLPEKTSRLVELRRMQRVDSESYSLLLSRYNDAKVEDTAEVSDIFIMDYAVEPQVPSPGSRLGLLVMIGIMCGTGCAFGPIILLDKMRRTAYKEFELEKLTSIGILESVPTIVRNRKGKSVNGGSSSGRTGISPLLISGDISPIYAKEVFRSLRTKILLSLSDSTNRNIVITSLESGAGKSLTSANLAISLAQNGLKVLLVDGDMRRGALHLLFGLSPSPGLSNFLYGDGNAPLLKTVQPTHIPFLSLMSSGQRVADAAELLTPTKMKQFQAAMATVFDILVFDTPPFGVTTDSVVIHELFSKYIIVAKAGATNILDLTKKINEYPSLKNKIAGIVLNQTPTDQKFKYYESSPYFG